MFEDWGDMPRFLKIITIIPIIVEGIMRVYKHYKGKK